MVINEGLSEAIDNFENSNLLSLLYLFGQEV